MNGNAGRVAPVNELVTMGRNGTIATQIGVLLRVCAGGEGRDGPVSCQRTSADISGAGLRGCRSGFDEASRIHNSSCHHRIVFCAMNMACAYLSLVRSLARSHSAFAAAISAAALRSARSARATAAAAAASALDFAS